MKTHFVDEHFDPMVDNPDNYRLGIFYFNLKDKRAVVPKRNRLLGLTVNFAHPYAYWWTIGIIAAFAEPTFWHTSLWMLICIGWVLSLIASMIGARVGRRATNRDDNATQ